MLINARYTYKNLTAGEFRQDIIGWSGLLGLWILGTIQKNGVLGRVDGSKNP